MQVCATTRAKLAEAETTPEKEMELKRIAKVEKWMKLREEAGMTVKAVAEMVDKPPTNLYRWKEDPSIESTRPHTLRNGIFSRTSPKFRQFDKPKVEFSRHDRTKKTRFPRSRDHLWRFTTVSLAQFLERHVAELSLFTIRESRL